MGSCVRGVLNSGWSIFGPGISSIQGGGLVPKVLLGANASEARRLRGRLRRGEALRDPAATRVRLTIRATSPPKNRVPQDPCWKLLDFRPYEFRHCTNGSRFGFFSLVRQAPLGVSGLPLRATSAKARCASLRYQIACCPAPPSAALSLLARFLQWRQPSATTSDLGP
jgi:hypothetical protein